MQKIKAIIFDWGRTLFDSDEKKEFLESEEVLKYCNAKGYRLGLVSLVSNSANATLEERNEQIEKSLLRQYFEIVKTVESKVDSMQFETEEKDKKFDEVVEYFGFKASEILIIDDRMYRGIKYANRHGILLFGFRTANLPINYLMKRRESQLILSVAYLS